MGSRSRCAVVSMNAFKTPILQLCCIGWVLCFAIATGCQNGPMSGRMQQYQLENERLLSEFRSTKKENEQLRADRSRLLQQQAETEKLAAKLQLQLSGGKSLAAQNGINRGDFSLGAPKNSADRSPLDSRGVANRSPQPGLQPRSDAAYPSPRSASNSDSLQWRPIRKETR
jgi:hypothetical protein